MTASLTVTEVARRLRAERGPSWPRFPVPGAFVTALAAEYGVSTRLVLRRIARLRRTLRAYHGAAVPVTRVPVAEVAHRYMDGETVDMLRAQYGVGKDIIRLAVWQAHDEGIIPYIRRANAVADVSPLRVVPIARASRSLCEAADLSWVNISTVRKIVTRAGMTLDGRRRSG